MVQSGCEGERVKFVDKASLTLKCICNGLIMHLSELYLIPAFLVLFITSCRYRSQVEPL